MLKNLGFFRGVGVSYSPPTVGEATPRPNFTAPQLRGGYPQTNPPPYFASLKGFLSWGPRSGCCGCISSRSHGGTDGPHSPYWPSVSTPPDQILLPPEVCVNFF